MRKALLVFPVVAIVMAPTVASANCPGLLGSGGVVYDILCTQGAGGGSDARGDRATGGGSSSAGATSSSSGAASTGTTGGVSSGNAGNAGNAGGLGVGDSGHKIANFFRKLFVKEGTPAN